VNNVRNTGARGGSRTHMRKNPRRILSSKGGFYNRLINQVLR
jgi:hypothetical protein